MLYEVITVLKIIHLPEYIKEESLFKVRYTQMSIKIKLRSQSILAIQHRLTSPKREIRKVLDFFQEKEIDYLLEVDFVSKDYLDQGLLTILKRLQNRNNFV